MIAVHLEPKGLSPDAEPLTNSYPLVSRAEAERGSRKLMEAILTAKGLPIPPLPVKPPRKAPALRIVPAPHPPNCCDKCGSPLKPEYRLISNIQAAVAAYYKLHPSAMVSQRRGRDISRPRQVAMYLSRELTPKSLPDIGRRFGGRDHTTVIHAIRTVESLMDIDPEVRLDVEILRRKLVA